MKQKFTESKILQFVFNGKNPQKEQEKILNERRY